MTQDDIERLASRLAMVVSEDGEAENAGRAMGQFARKLGLTGGQLKEIFVAGAAHRTVNETEILQLEREIDTLRSSNRQLDVIARGAERERDALLREVAVLRSRMLRASGGSRGKVLAGMYVLVAIALAGGIAAVIPYLDAPPRRPPPPVADQGAPGRRLAVVHSGRAPVFIQPDRTAPVVATLPAGMPVVVRRLLWNMLMQWAEVEVGSQTGYVLTSDIDLT